MAYIYNLSDAWNDAGTTFTAIKMNVTDTASAAGSLLLDLQVGGTSIASVRKNGLALFGPTAAFVNGIGIGTPSVNVGAGANVASNFAGGQVNIWDSNLNVASLNSGGLALRSTATVAWGSGTSVASADLFLARDAANILAQRNSTNAQTFRVYNTFTDASNYERGVFDWTTQSNALTIGTQQAGSGIARSLRLITQGDGNLLFITNSVTRFDVSSLGLRATANLIWTADNTYDIGASGANRPRDIFSARDVYAQSNTGGFYLGAASDVAILRDDANILAQRRSTNAQTFRIYETSTDASNYSRMNIVAGTNFDIQSQAAGTGTPRNIRIFTSGSNAVQFGTAGTIRWEVSVTGNFVAQTDNTSDIGASGTGRPRNLYMGSWIRMATTTVASLPAAATAGAGARMFVTDASAPVFGSAVAGGGAVTVPVYSTGSAWNVG